MTNQIPDFTWAQLSELKTSRSRPLVICDVDEVVVHFVSAFEDYLAQRDLWLDTSSFALTRNVRKKQNDEPLFDEDIHTLIDRFFAEETETLPAIDGAVESLLKLSADADVVMLTNLPHHAREKRIRNLMNLGAPFPVITNSGPKGPAINHLASLTQQPVVFIDDSPGFIASAREHAPDVKLVHLMQDMRYARHIQPFDYLSLYAHSWEEVFPHVQGILKG